MKIHGNLKVDAPVAGDDAINKEYFEANSPIIINKISETEQNADYSGTFAPSGTGLYRVTYYLANTFSDALSGFLTLSISYTDDDSSRTQTANTLDLTTPDNFISGSFIVELFNSSILVDINITGIFGDAKYSVYATCEKLS